VVLAVFAQLPRSRGDHAGAQAAGGSHEHLPLGPGYAPELEKRSRPHLKACSDSWRVDETYIKIKTPWTYLYRAVDSQGNTIEFFLSPTRDTEAAKRFFLKALHSTAASAPQAPSIEAQVAGPPAPADPHPSKPALRVINTDKKAAYPKAIAELKAAGLLAKGVELRQTNHALGVSML